VRVSTVKARGATSGVEISLEKGDQGLAAKLLPGPAASSIGRLVLDLLNLFASGVGWSRIGARKGRTYVDPDGCEDVTRAVSRWLTTRVRIEHGVWLGLLIAPVIVGLVWGIHLDDRAYLTFDCARDLATGCRRTHNLATGPARTPSASSGMDFAAEERALLRSPLYVLVLWLMARLGIPLPQAGLILSALGWGAAALAIYRVGQAMGRPVAAVTSATLVVFGPIVVSTLGTEVSWVAALAWIAVGLAIRGRWSAQAGVLALMLCVSFDLDTLALVVPGLIVQWIERKRFPLRHSLLLALAVLGWWLMSYWGIVAPFSMPHLNLDRWGRGIRQLLDESEFYWLFLPLIGLGLLAVARRALWVGLLCVALLILSGGGVSTAMIVTLGLFLTGMGIAWAIERAEAHGVFRLDRPTLTVSLALVAGLPLGVAHASSLVQRYQFRPVVQQELERQAADWLRAHTEPTATILGSARAGYLADRPAYVWDGVSSDEGDLAHLLRALNEAPADYCLSFRSLGWERLARTDWFQERYVPLRQFESPYDASSPLTIWGYRSSPFDLGERRSLDVQLPDGVGLVGYKYSPDRIEPGGAVYATLFLQPTRPVTESFEAVVEIVSPADGFVWAWRPITASSTLVGWWQADRVVAERMVLTTTQGIPVGAFHLDVRAVAADSRTPLPMYRDGDLAPLDRVTLGYVVVPCHGALDIATPLDVHVGSEISLLGYDAVDSAPPGAEFDVTLYWGARKPPEEDYVVFVHLLGADGQLASGHDGPPMGGRYPTSVWLPGDVVPDIHPIVLAPETPVGTYRLQVGMYRWPSLERLPVWDSQGVEQPDRVLVLQSIEVR
jgi:hypothetical protein